MDKVIIGEILRPQAIKGELKVRPNTRDIERFLELDQVYIDRQYIDLEYAEIRGEYVILKLKGYDDIDSVEKFRGKMVQVDIEDAIELEEGEYFIADVLGSTLLDETGHEYGKVKSIDNYGSSDIYTIKNDTEEFVFPYLEGVITSFDIENKKVFVSSDRIREVMV